MKQVIVSAALVGSRPTKAMNPAVPYTPAEIAQSAFESFQAGAAIVHVHVRDPETGRPSSALSLMRETVERIRDLCPVLINLTTSGFDLADQSVDSRLAPLTLQPEICSLDVGSLNFLDRPFANPPDWGVAAARRTQELGIKPELEVFDLGHVAQARHLVDSGLVDPPPWFQCCLGIQWGLPGTIDNLVYMHRQLPAEAEWSVLGVGAAQLTLTTVAPLLGGHIRVGFEDNLYYARGQLARNNAQLVERAVQILELLNLQAADVGAARRILGLA